MNTSNRAKLILVTFAMLLVGCSSASPLTTNVPATKQVVRFPTPVAVVRATIEIATPTLQPSVYSSGGITVTVDLNSFSNVPVLLSLSQKLVVVPPIGWGEEGWNPVFDTRFVQLDPQIDAKQPPRTGWVWIPKSEGETTITIASIPNPCLKAKPPCSVPVFGATLQVRISK